MELGSAQSALSSRRSGLDHINPFGIRLSFSLIPEESIGLIAQILLPRYTCLEARVSRIPAQVCVMKSITSGVPPWYNPLPLPDHPHQVGSLTFISCMLLAILFIGATDAWGQK
jgi:hypothetical protein